MPRSIVPDVSSNSMRWKPSTSKRLKIATAIACRPVGPDSSYSLGSERR